MYFILGWYILGLIGSYFIWLNWVLEFENYRCPTPRAILAIAFGGLGGIPLFLVGTVVIILDQIIERLYSKNRSSWWATPVCGNKEKR